MAKLMTPEEINALKKLVFDTNEIEEICHRRIELKKLLQDKSVRAAAIVEMANALLSANIGEERFRNFGKNWKFKFKNANHQTMHSEIVSIHYDNKGFPKTFEDLEEQSKLAWYPYSGFQLKQYSIGKDVSAQVFPLSNHAVSTASDEFDVFEDNFYHQVKLLLELDCR